MKVVSHLMVWAVSLLLVACDSSRTQERIQTVGNGKNRNGGNSGPNLTHVFANDKDKVCLNLPGTIAQQSKKIAQRLVRTSTNNLEALNYKKSSLNLSEPVIIENENVMNALLGTEDALTYDINFGDVFFVEFLERTLGLKEISQQGCETVTFLKEDDEQKITMRVHPRSEQNLLVLEGDSEIRALEFRLGNEQMTVTVYKAEILSVCGQDEQFLVRKTLNIEWPEKLSEIKMNLLLAKAIKDHLETATEELSTVTNTEYKSRQREVSLSVDSYWMLKMSPLKEPSCIDSSKDRVINHSF